MTPRGRWDALSKLLQKSADERRCPACGRRGALCKRTIGFDEVRGEPVVGLVCRWKGCGRVEPVL